MRRDITKEVRAKLQGIAKQLTLEFLPDKPGFALLVFTENALGDARVEYVSNCSRPEIRKAMLKWLEATGEPGTFGAHTN